MPSVRSRALLLIFRALKSDILCYSRDLFPMRAFITRALRVCFKIRALSGEYKCYSCANSDVGIFHKMVCQKFTVDLNVGRAFCRETYVASARRALSVHRLSRAELRAMSLA
jgi:hypothetical protein